MLEMLRTIFDLGLVIVGFGLIVFIHELGHFVAARWAGIRVLAFALGFGPAVVSYRQGLGLRRGSSEPEYIALADRRGVSPTEYRLNALPFGGYVKMLGQDDMNPLATSTDSDSYQSCAPAKRMVVISAGVVMNLILAAVLFVIVFMAGLRAEPAAIGFVASNKAAAMAKPLNPAITAGLLPGDVIESIDGQKPDSFSDVMLAAAMSAPGDSLRLGIKRTGVEGVQEFEVTPLVGDQSKLLELGIAPPQSLTLMRPRAAADVASLKRLYATIGMGDVEPGMKVVSINGKAEITGFHDLQAMAKASGGAPLQLRLAREGGNEIGVTLAPAADMQVQQVMVTPESTTDQRHLLGLTPVLRVSPIADPERMPPQGLMPGDIFAKLGAIEFPSVARGIGEIKAHANRQLDVIVLRKNDGALREVALTVNVNGNGQIGFSADMTSDDTLVALPVKSTKEGEQPSPASRIINRPGLRVVAVGDVPVGSFSEIRAALREATKDAGGPEAAVKVTLESVATTGSPVSRDSVEWYIPAADVAALHALGWSSPIAPDFFEPEQTIIKADGPVAAIAKGLKETRRVMLTTYVTFARLFQGTVKVEHLKGPVGIAHIGTMVAEQGWIKLFFFLALISVNLAVINFLPLPIVDGGQFIFLVIEAIRGKPVPERIQGAFTLAGMALIGTMFLVVTFHDVMNLLR
jgi:regulator of sigma E protease